MNYKDLNNLPIFKKANHIFQLVEAFVQVLPEDNEFILSTGQLLLQDAMLIPAKIAGAEGGNLYSIRMQNAALIRHSAMDLFTLIGGLKYEDGFKEVEYINMIRHEIDEFKLLFIDWVAGFDTNNYIWDDWELFNPKGAIPPNPNDYEDPFDPNDFLNNFDNED